MEQIRISGKDLGELALELFCPRCFWIKRHVKKLPFQIFPGIFSTIDSYSKKITNINYLKNGRLPSWIEASGLQGKPIKVPHHSKFNTVINEQNILLTGAPDEMIQKDDSSYVILDYKTAKFTETHDELLPIYDIQLNSYAFIAEQIGLGPVSGLGLWYYEPYTDVNDSDIVEVTSENGFHMKFVPKYLNVEIDGLKIEPLLIKVRQIYDMPRAPQGYGGCKNCEAISLLASSIL